MSNFINFIKINAKKSRFDLYEVIFKCEWKYKIYIKIVKGLNRQDCHERLFIISLIKYVKISDHYLLALK